MNATFVARSYALTGALRRAALVLEPRVPWKSVWVSV